MMVVAMNKMGQTEQAVDMPVEGVFFADLSIKLKALRRF